jgi:hypothetical protein
MVRDGEAVNVETERRDGGAFSIVGLPERNNPTVTANHLAALDLLVEGPVAEQRLTVTFPAHQYVMASVQAGWLRAAYLVAFARYGYRYCLRRLFNPVRAQIADPTGRHIERFYVVGASPPRDGRQLLSVATPRSMRSLTVVMGRHMIFLPGFHADSDTLYQRLGQRALWPPPSRSLRFGVTRHSWPSKPEHSLDFATV